MEPEAAMNESKYVTLPAIYRMTRNMIPPTSHDFGKPLFETKHESEGQYDPAYT
jgi:hypothetical protein